MRTRLLFTAEDIPPGCWARDMREQRVHYLVVGVTPTGVLLSLPGGPAHVRWSDLAKYFSYSTDRRHWWPCTKDGA